MDIKSNEGFVGLAKFWIYLISVSAGIPYWVHEWIPDFTSDNYPVAFYVVFISAGLLLGIFYNIFVVGPEDVE